MYFKTEYAKNSALYYQLVLTFIIFYFINRVVKMMPIEEAADVLGLGPFLLKGQLISGPFKKIRVHYSEKKQKLPENLSVQIKKDWEHHLETHPSDFDGMLASVISIKQNNGDITIRTRKSSFSVFSSLEKTRPTEINGVVPIDRRNCIPLSVGAVAITKDNKIVLAMRHDTTFDNKLLTFLPGGYIDPPADEKNGKISILSCIKRELKEELGIKDYDRVKCLGIVHSKESSKQPLVAVRLILFDSSQSIRSAYGPKNCESSNLCLIDNNIYAMAKFLNGKKIAIHDAWKIILHFSYIA
ncbi:NUDIX hydrolase [bacterium]|nr:NUDIX hydrolase [bacterium]